MTSARGREDGCGNARAEGQATGLYTETLARLYMQQGHDAKALAIYRHLISLQPDNTKLRAKAAALERQLAASGPGDAEDAAGDRTRRVRVIARLEGWLGQLRRQRQVSQTMPE